MAALSEKTLWPIVGIFIFGILAGLYFDDRRKLIDESTAEPAEQQTSTQQTTTASSSTSYQTKNSHKPMFGNQPVKATSMGMDEYLAKSSNERDHELKANIADHQGFSGDIDEYLSGAKSNLQASSNSTQVTGATSMSMDEYLTKNSSQTSSSTTSMGMDEYLAKSNEQATGATSMSMDEYLTKNSGKQTQLNNSDKKPFNKKEHMGFHGSYEDYAKKYN